MVLGWATICEELLHGPWAVKGPVRRFSIPTLRPQHMLVRLRVAQSPWSVCTTAPPVPLPSCCGTGPGQGPEEKKIHFLHILTVTISLLYHVNSWPTTLTVNYG